MCKSLTNYFPRNNDFLVTYFGKTQIYIRAGDRKKLALNLLNLRFEIVHNIECIVLG